MNILSDINQISRDNWQRLLSVSKVASWFQSYDAYEFYASLPEIMTPFVVAVEREQEGMKGLVAGYIPREKNALRQFFMRRAVIIGGPLLSDDISEDELRILLSELGKMLHERAIYVETRNFNDYSGWKNVFQECGFNYHPHYDIHIDCSDGEAMWQRIHESKKRAIKKYENDGWTIAEASSEEEVRTFYRLLDNLYRKKVHRPLFSVDFFLTGWRNNFAKLLITKDKDGIIQGGIFCPIGCDCLYEWYVVGSVVPTFAAMKYANLEHISRFDLMGAGEPGKPYGVRDFKMQFGGNLKEYGRFVRVNHPVLYQTGRLGIAIIS